MRWAVLALLMFPVAAKERPKTPPHHHVVEVAIPAEMTVKPPLARPEDGMLKCPVCHGIEDIDRRKLEEIDESVKTLPEFLRGGPYSDLQPFCAHCHDPDEHKRPNIHAMLDERGQIRESHCTYCHEVTPDRKKAQSLDEVKLRAPVESLCFGCHLKAPHWNALAHQVKPSDKVKRQRERYLQEHPNVILPLTPDGQVTCVTCHTPHPGGVLAKTLPAAHQVAGEVEKGPEYVSHPWAKTVVRDKQARIRRLVREGLVPSSFAFEYRQITQEALLRLPAKNGQLCRACHVFEE